MLGFWPSETKHPFTWACESVDGVLSKGDPEYPSIRLGRGARNTR